VTRYSAKKITALLLNISKTTSKNQKGLLLEELILYIFKKCPGVELISKRELNAFRDEEVDALFWNGSDNRVLGFLGCTFAVECKSWSRSVGSRAIVTFKSTLKSRGCSYGILITLKGISGDYDPPTQAYHEIAFALNEMCHILVMTREEIASLRDTDGLAFLLKQKACDLARKGTAI
jgi:hypothetical protein